MTGHDLIPVTIGGAFAFGMVLALLGSIKLPLAKRLNVDEAKVGGQLSALNLALIPMMLFSGLLVDHFGVRWVLVGGSLLTSAAVAALAVSRTYTACLYALLLLGAGGACVSVGSIKLMPLAFFDQYPAASLNLGNVFFGLGALTMPPLTDLLNRRLGLRRTLSVVAVVCLVPAALALLTAGTAFPEPVNGDAASVFRNPTLWLAGLVFLLYGPIEGAIATWTTTFLTELGYRERSAAWLLAGFWLAFLGGRLLTSFLQQREYLPENTELWFILGLALAAAVVLGNLAGARGEGNAIWGLLALGALLGPIFPTLVGFLFNQEFARNDRGTAYGGMFAIGATGSLILAPLIGSYARRRTMRAALRIPAVEALLLAAATLALALLSI